MGVLAWSMMGIAIWHFAIFIPDRFWGGIVGSFLLALIGSVVVGLRPRRVHRPRERRHQPAHRARGHPGRAARARRGLRARRPPRERRAASLSVPSSPPPTVQRWTRSDSTSRAPRRRAAVGWRTRSACPDRSPRCSSAAGSPTRTPPGRSSPPPTRTTRSAFAGHGRGDRADPRPRRSAARAIVVHGDYDCDGVSATAILVRTLRDARRHGVLVPPQPLGGRLRARARPPSSGWPPRARSC